ncbi:hypothetical protein KTE52_31375 [Burkholderia multivorans]|uniref:Uncharacterized protein n=1 Tax=Burkholderia multivorans TaxID=87883 RepID=A0AAP2MRR8_9BURK|nr:hypothetical protein [Burkholderia multivorans]MBU9360825.1 hypothetical protein [Burkholderia multivorans]
MNKTLTDEQIRKIAEKHFWGGHLTTVDDLEKAIRAALLATQQPEPRASASFIAAAIAVIKAARAHVLTDEHIDALDIAIKIQQGMFKVPEPRDEVTPLRVERHSDMSVVVVFSSCRQASVFEKEILARTGAAHE